MLVRTAAVLTALAKLSPAGAGVPWRASQVPTMAIWARGAPQCVQTGPRELRCREVSSGIFREILETTRPAAGGRGAREGPWTRLPKGPADLQVFPHKWSIFAQQLVGAPGACSLVLARLAARKYTTLQKIPVGRPQAEP